MVVVRGSRGSGKSLFVKKVNSIAKDYGMQVFSTAAQENTRAAPFATIRTMLCYLLDLDNVAGVAAPPRPSGATGKRNSSGAANGIAAVSSGGNSGGGSGADSPA